MTDITSGFLGISTPTAELHEMISGRGWTVKKVGWSSSQNAFLAEAINPHGESVKATGPNDRTALGHILQKIVRKEFIRSTAARNHIQKGSTWQDIDSGSLKAMAKEYAQAPVYEVAVAGYWKELAEDSDHRADVIRQQLKVKVTDKPEPYDSCQEMLDDIHKNKKLTVSRANTHHPIWSVDEAVNFRIVHDVMGYAVSGGNFDWSGELKACAAHAPLLSPTAQVALMVECVYQAAYASHHRSFGPQKIFNPKIDNPLENHAGIDRGLHPSQTVVPTSAPTVPLFPQPEEESTSKTAASTRDVNHQYNTGVAPVPGNDAYMEHGDPLEAKATMDNASLIDTKWSKMDPNTPSDRVVMKQAIVNAFRVVLLSPRKDLSWNAKHYQDISHVPADVTDPKTYWDALEEKRKAHNVARGRHPEGHLIYFTPRKNYYRMVQALNPNLTWDEAMKKADTQIFHWRVDEERKINAEDENKAPDKQKSADEIERRVNEAIARRLKAVLDDAHDPKTDKADTPAPQTSLFGAAQGQQDIFTGEDSGLYGAWMGSHLKAIAQISQHVEGILAAALEDVQQHDGAGHHFRSNVLRLGVSGVGPKVCSFAWLILQPMTSQLATIDTHMMDVLGHNYEKEMGNRNYFKFERELQAGRDASGYGHVPLGAFQWGMWDHKRNGPGQHQDHSAMSALNPTPHANIDWNAKAEATQQAKADWAKNAPAWWQATQEDRDRVAKHYDETIGSTVAQGQIPYQEEPEPTLSKVAGEPGDYGLHDHDFDYYWDKFKPFSKNEAKKMAEYAAGTKMTKTAARLYIEKHKSDIRGDFDEFVSAFMSKFNRLNHEGKAKPSDPWVPWLQDNLSFRTGRPGQSYAAFFYASHGVPGSEFYKLKDASLGKYNPLTRELVIGAGTPDRQDILDNLSVLHYDPTQYAR